MVFIPTWIINLLFLSTCILAAYQHWRLNRENPVTNLQFVVMVVSILMIVVVLLYTRHHANPWVTLGFFLIAVAGLFLVVRQQRMLPPSKAFE
jgi:hypothetical protein